MASFSAIMPATFDRKFEAQFDVTVLDSDGITERLYRYDAAPAA